MHAYILPERARIGSRYGARIRTVFSQQPWCTSDAATVLRELPPPGRLAYRLALKPATTRATFGGSEADRVDLDALTAGDEFREGMESQEP